MALNRIICLKKNFSAPAKNSLVNFCVKIKFIKFIRCRYHVEVFCNLKSLKQERRNRKNFNFLDLLIYIYVYTYNICIYTTHICLYIFICKIYDINIYIMYIYHIYNTYHIYIHIYYIHIYIYI